jgi:hypothetical protein
MLEAPKERILRLYRRAMRYDNASMTFFPGIARAQGALGFDIWQDISLRRVVSIPLPDLKHAPPGQGSRLRFELDPHASYLVVRIHGLSM